MAAVMSGVEDKLVDEEKYQGTSKDDEDKSGGIYELPKKLENTKAEDKKTNEELLTHAVALLTQHVTAAKPNNSSSSFCLTDAMLPYFYGNMKEYKAFKEGMMTVFNIMQSTPLERFMVLRSKLKGAGLKVIRNAFGDSGELQQGVEIIRSPLR
ncbi:CLUMA_CG002884, isoform A [Clunio marinus]|uniref:CLUMA_CG002884, isoform A n=1 Tax=Clunio marinus TaxID=568069 RepID=A0A1J1HMM8_9DIPT|nr:CLUMA_CG002884, isoform A [Clunio marinus]